VYSPAHERCTIAPWIDIGDRAKNNFTARHDKEQGRVSMTHQSRLFWIGSAVASFALSGMAQSQERPANTQLPQQVLPTGAEDAVAPASANARRATPEAAAPNAAQLERELVRMTSESDQGLNAVKLSDGSVRVDLDGRFMSVLVATPTSDGGDEITCHTGKDAAEKVKQAQRVIAGTEPKPVRTAASTPKQSPVLEEK
jgi:hypothetical protein